MLSENWQSSLQEAQSRLVHVHQGLAQKEKLRFMTWLINWNALGLYKTGSTSIKTAKICQKCQQTDVWDWWTIKQNTHKICAKLGNQHYLMIPMTDWVFSTAKYFIHLYFFFKWLKKKQTNMFSLLYYSPLSVDPVWKQTTCLLVQTCQ